MSALTMPPHPYINPFQLGDDVFGTTIISTAAQTLPQTATSTLFTVSGGAVLVTGIWGIVQTAIQNAAINLSLGLAPTTGTAATAGIGGPSSIQNLVSGAYVASPATAGSGGVSLTAPAVPATTVAVTNNYHGTVDVAISGGTVTSVNVNGAQVATTTGVTVSVPAHGQIAVTYSVAPTWTWSGSVALEVNASGALSVPRDVGFVAPPGLITWTTSASRTGSIKWYMSYMPFEGPNTKGPRVA